MFLAFFVSLFFMIFLLDFGTAITLIQKHHDYNYTYVYVGITFDDTFYRRNMKL